MFRWYYVFASLVLFSFSTPSFAQVCEDECQVKSPYQLAQDMNTQANTLRLGTLSDYNNSNDALTAVATKYNRVRDNMTQLDKDNYQSFIVLALTAQISAGTSLSDGSSQLVIAAKYLEAARTAPTFAEQNALATQSFTYYANAIASFKDAATSVTTAVLYSTYIDSAILSGY